MLKRRMIGSRVINKYEFRQMGAEPQALYMYLLVDCDHDGVCDNVYEIMKLNNFSNNSLFTLFNTQFVLPLLHDQRPDVIVWLPDFLIMNEIKDTKGLPPSIYRDALRKRYPWAPVLIVKDQNRKRRTDIINDNNDIGVDPRTGLAYITPPQQLRDAESEILPTGNLRVTTGIPTIKDKDNNNKIKSKKDDDGVIITNDIMVDEDENTYIFNLFCDKIKAYKYTTKNLTLIRNAIKKIGKEKVEKVIINESNRYVSGEYGSFTPNLAWVMGSGLDECVRRLDYPQKNSKNAGRLANDRDIDFKKIEEEIIENY